MIGWNSNLDLQAESLSAPLSDADVVALRDILWKMYEEHATQTRHHETQRSTVASALIAISSAILGVVTFQKTLSLWDLPLTLLLTAIGVFGLFFAAKHYERFGMHMERARAYRDELDKLLPGSPLKRLKEEADTRSVVPIITKLRLNWLWYVLNGLVCVLGVVLSAMAVWWPVAIPSDGAGQGLQRQQIEVHEPRFGLVARPEKINLHSANAASNR